MKTITKQEYLQLTGLLTLSYRWHKYLVQCEENIAELLDESGDKYNYEHISDSIWSELYSPDELLRKMDIEVEDE